jgi:hypothetical protein
LALPERRKFQPVAAATDHSLATAQPPRSLAIERHFHLISDTCLIKTILRANWLRTPPARRHVSFGGPLFGLATEEGRDVELILLL